jgi:signal transduction histidine kinase
LPRIWERFYKGDKSRSKEGNGLGLVIVKKIVELSKGKIYFESEVGKGSKFSVELPFV